MNSERTPTWKLVGITVVLAGVYATISGLGIKVFERCEDMQSSEKWKNIKMYLSHTVTLGTAIPFILLIQRVLGTTTQELLLASLYCIMGAIGSAMTLALAQECEVGDKDQMAKTFGGIGVFLYFLVLIAGPAWLFKKSRSNV